MTTLQDHQIPRDLVECLRVEARNAANPPTEYVLADDGGRMIHKQKPDLDMAELLDQAANRITADGATIERLRKVGVELAYTLGCIANEDWRDMTADDAREEARAALNAWRLM